MSKTWKIMGIDDSFSDEELILLLKNHQLNGKHKIKCNEMKEYMEIKDTIYQFYLEDVYEGEGNKN